MGGVVSTGIDNDDLINNLLQADYIKTATVERVFRAVDRADYFLDDARGDAYKDSAWKNGHMHLSAPCIYSEVMEGLQLKSGLSFLNLGSGTGYLSTMVGLILGPYGTNHGIEIYEDVIQYANKKLDDFKKCSAALDEYEFCPPKFVRGNCLCLNTDFPQYDRVYCGAACPEQHENYLKNLIKVGGVLIMPLNDKLMQIRRTSETTWEETFLLSVSFASLVMPSGGQGETPKILDFEPLSLQAICRSVIRTILRNNIDIEHPDLKKIIHNTPKRPKKKRALRRLVVPIFEESDMETSDNDDERRDHGRVRIQNENNTGREFNTILDLVLGSLNSCRNDRNREDNDTEQRRESQSSDSEHRLRYDSENSDNEESKDNKNCDKESIIDKEASSSVVENSAPAEEKKQNKREKFDSGLGDDLLNEKWSSDSENTNNMDIDSDSDDNSSEKAEKGTFKAIGKNFYKPNIFNKGIKLKRFAMRGVVDSDSDSEVHIEEAQSAPAPSGVPVIHESPYTQYMRAKIQALPLPNVLKLYLNLYREL